MIYDIKMLCSIFLVWTKPSGLAAPGQIVGSATVTPRVTSSINAASTAILHVRHVMQALSYMEASKEAKVQQTNVLLAKTLSSPTTAHSTGPQHGCQQHDFLALFIRTFQTRPPSTTQCYLPHRTMPTLLHTPLATTSLRVSRLLCLSTLAVTWLYR